MSHEYGIHKLSRKDINYQFTLLTSQKSEDLVYTAVKAWNKPHFAVSDNNWGIAVFIYLYIFN